MAKKGHVTFGGLGQHEYYAPTTGQGQKNRRNRRRCRHYDAETKYCDKLRTNCVGPTLCKKYSFRKNTSKGKPTPSSCPKVGTVVHSQYLGEGKITSIKEETCTIEFKGIRIQRSFKDIFRDFHFTIQETE